jgi:acetyltransferase-like isoleucine patch superfamily enzyme
MAITFVIIFLLQVTVLKNILMRNTQPGDHSIYSFWYLRKWCVDVLLQLSLHTVYTMYATMYLPPWLRTLGAKLGKGTEVSTAADYCPDLLDIGDGCFVADSVYLGVPTVYMGVVRMAQLKVGSRTFLGNGACLSLDSDIGSDALLGVMSTPPPVKPVASSAPGGGMSKEEAVALSKAPITWPETRTLVSDNTSYLGSPPMLLPRRQQAQGNFDVASTFQPTKWLHVQRLTWEFFRITLPFMFISALMLMYMGNFEYILFENDDTYAELALFWIVIWPACYIGAAVVCCFLVLLFKWVLVGTYVPGEAPLWSHFVWRTELCVGLMESLANPFFINHLRGTPFVCMWFRLLGSTVGERVWMDTTQITEPDLVHIGHDVVLQQDCTLQTHLFEDRIMKMSNLHVDNFCSVGTMSVLLYDSHMREGSHIGDLSLLMKGEQLEPWTRSEGIPCQPIRK